MATHQTDPPEIWPHLAEVIAGQLRLRRISQRRTADLTGISIRTLSKRLTCKTPFTIPELEAIAPVLGVQVHDFFIAADHQAASGKKVSA